MAHPLFRNALWVLIILLETERATAQCYNWNVSANITAASTCAANGVVSVNISGPDAANLSNLQYGIPIAANGFSVPLNSATTLTGMPPGPYTVSAVGICGGVHIGRSTTVTVPGSYQLPTLSVSGSASLSCMATGILAPNVINGTPPFTYLITSYPAAYTGPLTATSSARTYSFKNMPPGSYTVKVIDVCQNGTALKTFSIGALNPATQSYQLTGPYAKGCDTLVLYPPGIYWYSGDSFKVSMQISGGILSATLFQPIISANYTFKLPAGSSIKDCYGKVVTYTILPPCGPAIVKTITISGPSVSFGATQNCLTNFTIRVVPGQPVCMPITYTVTESVTNTSYGPFIYTGGPGTPPSLPFGSKTYQVAFTTGDGATGTGTFSTIAAMGNPYSVSVFGGAQGLHNYVGSFRFLAGVGASTQATVDLFSGPAGYTYHGQWSGGTSIPYYVSQNGTPTPTTLLFPPGNYVWKITDNCGVYYLPVTVGASDLYQFTVGPPILVQTCAGLMVTPTGTATHNGVTTNIGFSLLQNGQPYFVNIGGSMLWPVYLLGTPIYLTEPGTYTILPTSVTPALFLGGYYRTGGFSLAYPNIYMPSYTFICNIDSPSVDMSRTQGFLCKGGAPGSGQIFATGKGGIPYTTPAPHYNFALAAAGFGLGGPYIASNATGIFTNIGANANSLYDLRVTDSCGAFAIQRIRILPLDSTRLISSSQYVACQFDSVRLSALYLPNATYSWTGPGGFTSSQREPMIYPTSPLQVGIYRVSVTTAQCSGVLNDSTILAMNPAPSKPMVTYLCMPRPIAIKIINPSSGFLYKWDIGYLSVSNAGIQYSHPGLIPSDTLLIKYVGPSGTYNAVALDTITGCKTYSDTLLFFSQPHAVISATHQDLCPGDSTTLIAGGKGTAPQPLYQWLRNGAVIPGANGATYSTPVAGNYRVRIETGPCDIDTSTIFVVKAILSPIVTLSASPGVICDGGSVTLQTVSDTAYTYTWIRNGTTIPGATAYKYQTAIAGTYSVIVANAGCVAASAPLSLFSDSSFAINPVLPDDTLICNAANSFVAAVPASLQGIRWSTGDTTAGIRISSPGKYWVEGHNLCGTLRDTLNARFCEPLIRSIVLANDSICEGDCTQMSAYIDNYPQQYQWLFAGGMPAASSNLVSGPICYSKAGIYPVMLIVRNAGGSDTMTSDVVVSAKPEPRFVDTALMVSYKNLVSMPACADAQTADWYQGDSLICGGCPALRIEARYYYNVYRCVVRNGSCADSCSYTLRVVDIPNDLWLPDAFTPNGDGRNDVFRIITDNPNIQVVNMDVFNRWGQRVFTSNLNNLGWDGSFRGKAAESGTYFWQLRYRVDGNLDKTYTRQGDLLLIR